MKAVAMPRAVVQPPTAMTDNLRQAHGRVRPGTQESRSQSRSLSPEDPTRHTQQLYRVLLQKASCWGMMQPYKLHTLAGATAVSQTIGQRRCHSPKVDGGKLQKAALEASLARKKDVLAPQPYCINSCKTSKKSAQGFKHCVWTAVYVDPHLL